MLAKITLEHHSFLTQDHLELPALLYRTNMTTKRVALFLHGNGSASVFYKAQKMQTFAQELTQVDCAFFAFNNRGAHYIKKFSYQNGDTKEQYFMGTALEKIADCVLDINAAITFLKTLGFSEFILVGESTGANKICVFDSLQNKNDCIGYALVGGGDDTGLWYQSLGENEFSRMLKLCQTKIAQGKGEELLSTAISHGIMTYQALLDTIDPDGFYNCFPFFEATGQVQLSTKPLFHLFAQIAKPMLVMYGEMDEFCVVPPSQALLFLQKADPQSSKIQWHIEPGADHSFSQHEREEAQAIAEWIEKL